MKRRHVLRASVALGFPAIMRGASEGTAPLDAAMQTLLARYDFPGGALGIARNGRIAYAKGFGFANKESGIGVQADSRFRLASVSKPITSAAVLRLVDQGKLALDEAVLPRLKLAPLGGGIGDAQWDRVTVRHLLQHTGGWSKERSGDAMFKSPQICREVGIEGPADARTTVRWMLGQRLDFEPGTDYSYCNFGYCVLGRLIEAVTGQSYESAVRKLVLSPCGATGMALGHSLRALKDEVTYYNCDDSLGSSVFPGLPGRVAWPYGTFSLEANDANGGWVSTVSEYLRFLLAMDHRARKPLLSRDTMQALAASVAPGSEQGAVYYGLGWLVRPQGQAGRPNLWHIGGLPGTKTIAVRLGDGFDWVALFNSRPAEFEAANTDIQSTIYAAARQVPEWR